MPPYFLTAGFAAGVSIDPSGSTVAFAALLAMGGVTRPAAEAVEADAGVEAGVGLLGAAGVVGLLGLGRLAMGGVVRAGWK